MSDLPQREVGADNPGRRYVTLLFSDLARSTELAGAMEAERYADLLAALRAAYQHAIPRCGGSVVRVQGDGLLAMFGHPATREDDGRRAVEAALLLHQQVRQLTLELPPGFALSLHTGIHSGLVLIGAGDIERGRFELLGPVPHIAARLSDAARPHEILVSEETLGPARRFFSAGAPEMLQVKGREAPILIYRVDARADVTAPLQPGARSLAPFVGRQLELAQLERELDSALVGQPCSVAVAGAAGIGKTRLVEEFLGRARQRGCRVLRGQCESDLRAEPLLPFTQMRHALAAEEPPKTNDAWAAWFARLAEEQPLVLFIDDWQWADDASRQVLTALHRVEARPILVLLTLRGADAVATPAGSVPTIALAPLDELQAAQAVRAQLPAADPFVVAQVCSHAGGNPLFIEELCHSVARGESGRLGVKQGTAGWLSHLVESRVQHLQPALAELVRTAAVIGNVVPAWLLARITGRGVDDPLVHALAEQDLLFPGERAGTLRFKHGVMRDVIYASVGLLARQALHLRIAVTIQQQGAAADDEALLAYHFGAGGDATLAAHYAELAGDKALAASALDRARAQYSAALAALERGPLAGERALRWVNIVQRLSMVCMFDPSRRQIALCERAVQLAEQHGDMACVGGARHWLGYVHAALGDSRAAIAHGERALIDAEFAGDAPLASQIVAALGEAYTAAACYGPAVELLDRAIAVKRQHRSGRHTNVGLAWSLVCRAWVLGDRGLFSQSAECFDEAQACVLGITHQIGASIQGWRSAVLLWQGHWAAARDAAAESGRIAEATHSLWQLSVARAIGGYARWMSEGRPEALQDIVEVTEWLEPRDSGLFRSLNHGWLAAGLGTLGRRGEMRRHAALALQRGRGRDLIGVAMAYRALARDAAALQRREAAQRYLARAHGLLDAAEAAFEAMDMRWHRDAAARLRTGFMAASSA